MSANSVSSDIKLSILNTDSFERSSTLLEFDQIKAKLSSWTRTSQGRKAALALEASTSPFDIASKLQETTEARTLLDQKGGLEFGPDEDLNEWIRRVLLD